MSCVRLLALCAVVCLSSVLVIAQEAGDADKPAEPKLSDDAQAILDRLDSDGDGKIAKAELDKRAQRVFDQFDKDGDGFLAGAELNSLAERLGQLKKAGDKRKGDDVAKAMKGPYERDEASGLFLKAAHDYHKATNGQALLILKNGKPLLEAYDNGFDAAREHELASGTKSYSGIVAALLVEEGLLTWDEKVCETLTEWKDDAQRSKITVRMLLSLCAGLPPETDALQGPRTKDKYAYAIALKCKHEPGTRFEYGPAQYYCFGELVQRKLKGEDIKAYFMRKLGEPLGMKFTWRTDAAGNAHVPHGAFMRAPEWAKFGEFIRLKGRHADKQLLKAELIDECFKPSERNKAYGLTWWLGAGSAEAAVADGAAAPEKDTTTQTQPEAWAPKDVVYAAGKGKQRLYISREAGLTIVRFADDQGSYVDAEFWSWLMRGKPV